MFNPSAYVLKVPSCTLFVQTSSSSRETISLSTANTPFYTHKERSASLFLSRGGFLGFPAKLFSFRISRNTKLNKFRVSRNKLVVSRNFALKLNKQFRMFRYFLNETKQSVSHVL
jgi:hypothetical protein